MKTQEKDIPQHLLIIGYLWPESKTNAAGVRMMQLIHLFLENGWHITFATTATKNHYSEDLDALGVTTTEIRLNDSSFDRFVKTLKPNVVMFDRFFTEEQFGWRVAENCPDSLRILDTEDLHFLRYYREVKLTSQDAEVELYSDLAKREIAAIYRCDLSLIISKYEMELLQEKFQVPTNLLFYLPFLEHPLSSAAIENLPSFSERKDFIFFGNYKHKPNLDAVIFLKKDIWPKLKALLPDATLHIYGAYAPQQLLEFHNPKERFYVNGWTAQLDVELQKARILLAPLRFGAGLKGKILKALKNGTVVVTTEVGAEGIFEVSQPSIGDDNAFLNQAIECYTNEQQWYQNQNEGFTILNHHFDLQRYSVPFLDSLDVLLNNLPLHRQTNFVGQLLQYHIHNSAKYMSKWIEEKQLNNS